MKDALAPGALTSARVTSIMITEGMAQREPNAGVARPIKPNWRKRQLIIIVKAGRLAYVHLLSPSSFALLVAQGQLVCHGTGALTFVLVRAYDRRHATRGK
ncbi:hypothetical protein UVI_02044720 [Ustilaginoidea virens]|uniref:Uncharacterized protein n=1 Tax=Ustilaginoidea virens TaxID=1159556 RepID=A0A1B5L4D3_USTVR|nr:hypothetical protein UVI_02044720 [Ustilaginoidea virens]